MTGRFVIEPLSAAHGRSSFSCGVTSLDRYFARQAGQDSRRHVANCFVAIVDGTPTVAGYYTLSASGIPVSALPDDITRRLPAYPVVPAALIGRLAVDSRFRRQGLGEALIFDAMDRALNSDPAVFAVVVEAIDGAAAAFYRHYQFRPLTSQPMYLFLPVASFSKPAQSDR